MADSVFVIAWGIFTLLQYRVTSYSELAAYRFLVGWFEAAFLPGMHYIFGAWYRGDEIARRGGCFYVGLTLGTLTASLIQAGASASLDGVNYGWVNSELRYSPIKRAVVLVTINVIAQSTTIWTPLLVFKTVEGPRFTKEYSFVLANAICLILTAHLIRYFTTREGKRHDSEGQDSVGSGEGGARDPEAVNYTIHPK